MKIYRTRVPYDVVARVFGEMGAIIQYDGSEVLLPSGEYILIYPAEDGGTYYMLPSCGEEAIKFVQRVFARANLIVKKMKTQAQDRFQDSGGKEERKKGTSEVSEFVSGTSDSIHGGDSASGEVPEGESGRGQESSSSNLALPLQEAGSKGGEESAQPSDASGLSPDLSSKEEGESGASDRSELEVSASEGEGSSSDGACPKSLGCASPQQVKGDASMDGQASIEEGTGSLASEATLEDILDILEEEGMEEPQLSQEPGELSTLPTSGGAKEGEAPEPEREVSPSLSFKELKKIMDRRQAMPSVQSRYNFGGISASLEGLYGIPPRELINRTRRIFARLVSEFGEGEEGPRWDRKKISTRTASYQNWRVFDRKKEVGRPAIAVLPDVSGSMAGFANQVLELSKVLMALGVPGAEVIVVVQSNGHPLELWINGRKEESFDYYYWNSEQIFDWYKNVFSRFDVKVVILAADWDGAWLYSRMAESMAVKIYWLDVYLSSKVYPTLSSQFPPKWSYGIKWSITASKKVRYIYGCCDVVDFVKGLELAINKK